MTALSHGGEVQKSASFFRDTDQRGRLIHAGKHLFHDRAAFVQHKGRADAPAFQLLHDGGRVAAHDFLIPAKGEIYVVMGRKATCDQAFSRFHHAHQRSFGIQGATSPQLAALHDSLKRRLVPFGGIGGHHVVVRHEHGGPLRAVAGPFQQHAVTADFGVFACSVHMWIQRAQQRAELFKFSQIHLAFLYVAHGFETDHLPKVFRC